MDRATKHAKKFNESLAKTLREIRRGKNLTQIDVAGKAGITHQHVGYIERGLRCPTVDVLVRLAWAFDVSVTEIIEMAEKNL